MSDGPKSATVTEASSVAGAALTPAFWRRFGAIAGLYWRSEDRWTARVMLALVAALLLAQTGFNVLYVSQTGEFTSALAAGDADRFWRTLIECAVTLAVSVPVYAFYFFTRDRLGLRWRRWLTQHFLETYLAEHRYFALNASGAVDNPDQRIADDINAFTHESLYFLLVALSALMQLVAFAGVLWSISTTLVAVLAVYALVGNVVATGVFGRILIGLNYQQLRREADFRFAMVRLREHAEPIAFHRGEAFESRRAMGIFDRAVANYRAVLRAQLKLTFFQYGFSFAALVLPVALIAPRVLAGELEVGVAVQAAGAFAAVLGAVTVIVDHFDGLSKFAAGVDRLAGFSRTLHAPPSAAAAPVITQIEAPNLALEHVTIATPDGRLTLIRDLSVAVAPGEGLMIVGSSGTGKSSLLRAIGGLWQGGQGRIQRPSPEHMMFLPQQPYMPLGTLRHQIVYPLVDESLGVTTLRDLLDQVHLPELIDRFGGLDAERDWAKVLSLGEQQRLAFARALLARPRYVMLDEATSALDVANEDNLYRRLSACGITPVSVSHRSELAAYHAHVLELTGHGAWRLTSARAIRERDR